LKQAADLSKAEISQLQDLFLKAFDRGAHVAMDRGNAANYTARIWYDAVTHFLQSKYPHLVEDGKNSQSTNEKPN
jgi:hypothetical protein